MIQFNLTLFSESFLIFTFLVINLGYLALLFSSVIQLRYTIQAKFLKIKDTYLEGFESPISILVPAYNESQSIIFSIRSLLNLEYPKYEIIIINDGSTDNTLQLLIEEFHLVKLDEFEQKKIHTKTIKGYYRSLKYKNIKVIDKENAGKADSLNAGINVAKYPYFCSLDADSVLEKRSLLKMIEPFLEDSEVIAVGGSIRVANGCKILDGKIREINLPNNLLSLIQIVEYIHAFLFGRLGWAPINSLLILSGAFSLFSKKHVIDVGGYKTNTIGEDMELVVRLHKYMRENKYKYKISFITDSICWTEVPQNLSILMKQRIRWQIGLGETLWMNKDIFFNRKLGVIGLFSFPFLLFVEFLTPIIEIIGYTFFLISFIFGSTDYETFVAFLVATVGLGILISISGIFIDEITFQIYKRKKFLLMLCLGAILENIGYRQINSFARLIGVFKFLFKKNIEWGTMKHQGFDTK